MKRALCGLCGLLGLWLSAGCSRVLVVQPLGEPRPTDTVIGVWRTTDQTQVRVTAGPGLGEVVVEELGRQQPQPMPGRVTTLGEGVSLLWVFEPEDKAYAVVRFAQRDDGAVVYPPDFAHVRRLLEAGTLRGRNLDAEEPGAQKFDDGDAWLIEPAGLAEQLAQPAFWDLQKAAPLLKVSGTE